MWRLLVLFLAGSLVLLIQAFSLQGCATPTAPQGGPIDTIGPQLVLEKSTPNFQTNFRPDRIELTFDEWVKMDPKFQILISPPIDQSPDQRPVLERRTLIIPMEGQDLLDSVTYVVNIGASIQDLNESNPTENLRFVFSTGPILDTASVSGTLINAYDGEPFSKAFLTLYGSKEDSIIYQQNPTYFAQADEQGRFTVFNVRPGEYRAVALERNPASTNYYLDFDSYFPPLSVGYLDSLISVPDDNITLSPIALSPVTKPIRTLNIDTSKVGQIKLVVNQKAREVDVDSKNRYQRINVQDTLKLFYRTDASDSLMLGRNDIYEDTVIVRVSPPYRQNSELKVVSGPPTIIPPGQSAVLTFEALIAEVDTSKIKLYRKGDLTQAIGYSFDVDSTRSMMLGFTSRWRVDSSYQLVLAPEAVKGYLGQSNQDTLRYDFRGGNPEKFSQLEIDISGMDETTTYLVRLLQDGDVVTGTEQSLVGLRQTTLKYVSIAPGDYSLQVIVDTNANGRFDGGDIRAGRQPESVQRFPLPKLRPNWEVKENVLVQ